MHKTSGKNLNLEMAWFFSSLYTAFDIQARYCFCDKRRTFLLHQPQTIVCSPRYKQTRIFTSSTAASFRFGSFPAIGAYFSPFLFRQTEHTSTVPSVVANKCLHLFFQKAFIDKEIAKKQKKQNKLRNMKYIQLKKYVGAERHCVQIFPIFHHYYIHETCSTI